MAQAKVTLKEGITCKVRGTLFKRGQSKLVSSRELIEYLKQQSRFAVTVIDAPVRQKISPPTGAEITKESEQELVIKPKAKAAKRGPKPRKVASE